MHIIEPTPDVVLQLGELQDTADALLDMAADLDRLGFSSTAEELAAIGEAMADELETAAESMSGPHQDLWALVDRAVAA